MALLRPDPTFYPSPRLAMQAPPEKLAYVAALNPPGGRLNDAMLVIDVDPASASYGKRVGQTVLPNAGDELHHFWWHITQDTLLSSEWGTPKQIENGAIPEELLQGRYGHQVHVWDLRKRRHVQALDLGTEHQMVLEMRPAHDPTKRFHRYAPSQSFWDGMGRKRRIATFPLCPNTRRKETDRLWRDQYR